MNGWVGPFYQIFEICFSNLLNDIYNYCSINFNYKTVFKKLYILIKLLFYFPTFYAESELHVYGHKKKCWANMIFLVVFESNNTLRVNWARQAGMLVTKTVWGKHKSGMPTFLKFFNRWLKKNVGCTIKWLHVS